MASGRYMGAGARLGGSGRGGESQRDRPEQVAAAPGTVPEEDVVARVAIVQAAKGPLS